MSVDPGANMGVCVAEVNQDLSIATVKSCFETKKSKDSSMYEQCKMNMLILERILLFNSVKQILVENSNFISGGFEASISHGMYLYGVQDLANRHGIKLIKKNRVAVCAIVSEYFGLSSAKTGDKKTVNEVYRRYMDNENADNLEHNAFDALLDMYALAHINRFRIEYAIEENDFDFTKCTY